MTTAVPTISMRPVLASDVARRYDLRLLGEDLTIETMGTVDSTFDAPALSFALSASWAGKAHPSVRVIVCTPSVAEQYDGPAAVLSTERDPQEVFYEIFYDSATEGRWRPIEGRIDPSARIAPSAVIAEHVVIGADCVIGANVVVLDNSVIDDGVVVKPNSTIGGDGFQVKRIRGRNEVVPHVGGVYLGSRVSLGSSTCVDRGLFGESTVVGEGTKTDNFVHIAHAVEIGPDAVLTAGVKLAGGLDIGRGVWLGLGALVSTGVTLGDFAYVGTGASVVRDVPAFGLAFGNPAKQRGWMCRCRTKLGFGAEPESDSTCASCGRLYRLADGVVTMT